MNEFLSDPKDGVSEEDKAKRDNTVLTLWTTMILQRMHETGQKILANIKQMLDPETDQTLIRRIQEWLGELDHMTDEHRASLAGKAISHSAHVPQFPHRILVDGANDKKDSIGTEEQ